MKLLIHGSGFEQPVAFRNNEPAELRCGKPVEVRGNPACHWSPASIDWRVLGQKSGGSTACANMDELLATIRAQNVESIEELRIIGHSNKNFLALGGTIEPDKVRFTESAMMGNSQTFLTAQPMLRQTQDRFTSDARIVLAGCGSGGIGSDLMDLVSHTFLRTVLGFTEPILYAIDGTTSGPEVRDRSGKLIGRRIDNDARITSRGKAMYSTAANAIENLFGSDMVGTGVLRTNAWELVPDAQSNAGDIFIAIRRKQAGMAATELAWRILQEFFPQRPWVSGTSVDEKLSGLRVRKHGTGAMIDVGPLYATRTTPVTLSKRVQEMQRALDLISKKAEGVIPLT